MQKAKKEDFRVEEELRSQKAKYEESSEDVLRRMEDIKEAEADSVADLGAFLDAELEYYDKARDELLRLKRDWPARYEIALRPDLMCLANSTRTASSPSQRRQNPRSRSNTVHSYNDRYAAYDEPVQEPEPVRASIRSTGRVQSSRGASTASSTRLENRLERLNTNEEYYDAPQVQRPNMGRSSTFQGPTSIYRESPISAVASRQNSNISDMRGNLRPMSRINTERPDVFGDPSDDSTLNSASPDRSYGARSVSPATSHGSVASRTAMTNNGQKRAPPPPPSRAKKPPPPPPMKRAEISSNSVNRY